MQFSCPCDQDFVDLFRVELHTAYEYRLGLNLLTNGV